MPQNITEKEKVVVAPDSTQRFVEVKEIKNGVVTLKGGGLRAVIMVGGINFDLKSQEEQDIVTASYQNFLNGLDFSLQTIIHSRKLNIDAYLARMEELRDAETSQLLKTQTAEYIEYIRGLVKDNEIMTKTFFVVVPYDGSGLKEVRRSITDFIPFIGKKKNKTEEQESLDEQIVQLQQRIDQVISGLSQIGLRAVVLNDGELTELYYNLYNPETTEKKLPNQNKPTAERTV
jgi:type IV secretory pathway VirB4 component